MKIDFDRIMHALEGQPMTEQYIGADGKEHSRDLTLTRACINALILDKRDEEQTDLQKYDRFRLAMRLGNEDQPMEITAEEVALIKKRAGIAYNTWAMGQVWSMLEGDELKSEEKGGVL